mgnify:FL=1
MSKAFNSMNINLYELAYVKTGSEWNCEYMCSGYTRIYMITGGTGYIKYKNTVVRLQPNNIYIIPAGLEFAYSCEDYLEKLYVHISIPGQNNYDIFNAFSECIVIENKENFIKKCVELFNNRDVISTIKLKCLLYEIVAECTENRNEEFGKINIYSDITLKAIKYIEKNMSASLTAEEVSKSLFISLSKLQKQFREDTGVSLGRYIDDRIMFRAERELKNQNASIKEISDKLGFCDQFYFSRKFSAKYGMPPSEYRRSTKDETDTYS